MAAKKAASEWNLYDLATGADADVSKPKATPAAAPSASAPATPAFLAGGMLPPSLKRQKVLPKAPAHRPASVVKKATPLEAHLPLVSAPIVPALAPNLSDTAITVEVQDPYDPANPNDYSEYCLIKEAERLAKIEEEEAIREMERQMEQEKARARLTGATIPPPGGLEVTPGAKHQIGEKMLLNMGWKGVGHGLGKNDQGVSAPLVMNKMAGNRGEILQAPSKQQTPAVGNNGLPLPDMSRPTKVVLLRNMVGPNEVDDALEGETSHECSKYGPVVRCVIDQSKDPLTPSDECVRTFVAFEATDAARKALVDLHGRFFAGRQVKASFYNEDAFRSAKYRLRPDE